MRSEGGGGSQYVDQAAPLVVWGSAQTGRHRDDAEQEGQLEQPLEVGDDAAPRRWQDADWIPEPSYRRQGRVGRGRGTLNQAPDEHEQQLRAEDESGQWSPARRGEVSVGE